MNKNYRLSIKERGPVLSWRWDSEYVENTSLFKDVFSAMAFIVKLENLKRSGHHGKTSEGGAINQVG